jgi:hypothetical protein
MTAQTLARTVALAAAAVLAGAAGTPKSSPFAMATPLLPSGTSLQASPPPEVFTPAPMPDPDQTNSSWLKAAPAKVEVSPNLFHTRQSYLGDGYTPNSTIQGEQTKRIHPAPGLSLSVPLQ